MHKVVLGICCTATRPLTDMGHLQHARHISHRKAHFAVQTKDAHRQSIASLVIVLD